MADPMVSERGHFSELFNVAASRPAQITTSKVDYARLEACVKRLLMRKRHHAEKRGQATGSA
jgi:hypothetical protein